MSVFIQSVEYLTTQEVMALFGICRPTWVEIARRHNIKHYTQVGKNKRFLWKKSDVEPLLKPIPVQERT